MRRKTALFLAAALSASAISLFSCSDKKDSSSVTEGSFTYEIVSDHATITGCSSDVYSDIVVPDNINGVPVTAIGSNAFYKCFGLKSVTIPSSVKKIGSCAFDSCIQLTAVSMEDGGVVTIESMAFNDCDELVTVYIPESVMSIEKMAFHDCGALKSVTIMNPECSIYDQNNTISNSYSGDDNSADYDGVIYGLDGSTAQKYAKKYGYKFQADGGCFLGDVNEDGILNASDASAVLVAYSKLAVGDSSGLSETGETAADVNSDSKIDSSDASLLLSYYSYKSTGGTDDILGFVEHNK